MTSEQVGRPSLDSTAADPLEVDSISMDPLSYIAQGWSIFPCHSIRSRSCTCGNPDCGRNAGKHPRTRNGFKDASNNPAVIQSWINQWLHEINWAVVTGRISGIFVVDVDAHRGGAWPEDLWGPKPSTLTAATGNGGWHHYFTYPSDGLPLGNRGNVVPGVDIKSDGGYVILPPSRHISGGSYAWLRDGVTS